MTSNELEQSISYKVRLEHKPYDLAVQESIDEIVESIKTDMSILENTRREWQKRVATNTLTDEFDRSCKELADALKKEIWNKEQLLK